MPDLSPEHDAEQLRVLMTRMLHQADGGLPLASFLGEVTKILLGIAGGGAVVVRVEDWIPHLHCRAIRSGPTNYRFETESDGTMEGVPQKRESPQSAICRTLLGGIPGTSVPCVTRRGSFWSGDARRCPPLDLGGDERVEVSAWARAGNFRSLLLVPFAVAGRPRGLLQVVSDRPDLFDATEVRFLEEVADILGVALSHYQANWALQERVKELSCLYKMSQVAGRQDLPLPGLLQEIVTLLPPAWQYPDLCAGRILLDGRTHRTAGFPNGSDESPPTDPGRMQSAPILVNELQRGTVDVLYTGALPGMGAVPFLEEEEKLIREIARQVGLLVERVERREERARLETQLRHADRLATLGKLTAGVAHELNEPIGSILGFAELLDSTADLPRQAGEDLKRIQRAALHAREIIKKLMFFGRQTPPGQVPVDLSAIVEEGLALLQPRLAKEKIRVCRTTDPDLRLVLADPRQLQQVVVNLAVNAIQAMPSGGDLTVSTCAEGDGAVLRVEDTGVGMSEETLAQIFVPFFTTKEVGQGIGLGLSVVHGIVTAHHGTIRVESEEEKGTRFLIRLPARGGDEPRGES